jgi:endonuclease/exonuclease/phosphatase family metal-dependent hydrolase
VILLGDYNLNPETQSLAILTQGRRNLISEYSIATTRSALYTKPLPYADYAIVSPDIVIKSFAVPYTEASDHLPLVVEIG